MRSLSAGLVWKGMRCAMPFTCASAVSNSGPVEAPVQTLILNGSFVMRAASASGTLFG